MTAKEKAVSLMEDFLYDIDSKEGRFLLCKHSSKQCALKVANEIIFQFTNKCCESANRRFWEEVKEQIELL